MRTKIFSAPFLILIIIAAASFFLMLSASSRDSLIMDELAHIPAGYGYVKYFDYRLNPEHPPLLKALSALPLTFMNLNFPTDKQSWQSEVNGQWWAGTQFIFESGNNPDSIIFAARIAPILLTILLIFFVYFWSVELLGRWWGLLPTFLFALSPTALAHGHYVTTDVAAAFGVFSASYYFIKYLGKPNKKTLIFAGIALGLAELLKFSTVLLLPFFIFIALIKFVLDARAVKDSPLKMKIKFLIKNFSKKAGLFMAILLIAFAVIYMVYFAFTFNYPIEKQAADTVEILTSFGGGTTPAGVICNPLRCLADLDIWMAGHNITRPAAEYLLGVLMVTQRSSGGNTAYFLGEVGGSGWWYYFPVVYLLKETIPVLIMIIAGFILAALRIIKSISERRIKISEYLKTNFAEFSMLVFVVFYWIYSIKSPLNIGVRHILPTLPFIYILTASSLKKSFFINVKFSGTSWLAGFLNTFHVFRKNIWKVSVLFILIFWFLGESVYAYPNYLSYFNELGSGKYYGYRIVTDSNYDWGQDLKALAFFVKENNVSKIAVDYFGGGSPAYYLDDKYVSWWSAKNNPKEEGVEWLAVSVNTLESAVAETAPGFSRAPEDGYLWLKTLRNAPQNYADVPKPDYRAGTSIFVYKL